MLVVLHRRLFQCIILESKKCFRRDCNYVSVRCEKCEKKF